MYRVLLPLKLPPLTYRFRERAKKGDIVSVQVKEKVEVGIIWSEEEEKERGKTKEGEILRRTLPCGVLNLLERLEKFGVPPQFLLKHVPLKELLKIESPRSAEPEADSGVPELHIVSREELSSLRGKRFLFLTPYHSKTAVPLPNPHLAVRKTLRTTDLAVGSKEFTAVGFISAAFLPFTGLDGIVANIPVPFIRLGQAEVSVEAFLSFLSLSYSCPIYLLKNRVMSLYTHIQLPLPPPQFTNYEEYTKRRDRKFGVPSALLSLLEKGKSVSLLGASRTVPLCPKCFTPLLCPECGERLEAVKKNALCNKCGLARSRGFCPACEELTEPLFPEPLKKYVDRLSYIYGDSVEVAETPEEAENDLLFFLYPVHPSKPSQLPWAWSKLARAENSGKQYYLPSPIPEFLKDPGDFIAKQKELRKKRGFPPFGTLIKVERCSGENEVFFGETRLRPTEEISALRKIKVDSGFSVEVKA